MLHGIYPASIVFRELPCIPKSLSCLHAFRDMPQGVRSVFPKIWARRPISRHRFNHILIFNLKSLRLLRHSTSQTRDSSSWHSSTMATNHTTTPPADYGHRLIPSLVDEYARTDPDYVFALVPKAASFADGLEKITISTFARAVNEIASRIDSTLGKSTDFDTIAYIGPSQSLRQRK